MPVLSNPRQERFAQAAARGAGNSEAHRAAGYACRNPVSTRAAACRLRHLPDVDARIAEIQAQSAAEAKARTAASPAALTLELLQVAAEARALKSASGLATARAALMDAARLNGLLPDRKNGGAGSGAAGVRAHEDALADLEP